MRALAGLVVALLVVGGVYYFYLKRMPTSDAGTAPTQAISMTGVRSDLLQIAQAERAYVAQNGHCVELSELLSSGSMTMSRSERDGYTYSIECAGAGFSVNARHDPAPAGSSIRYPNLSIDQNMQIQEVP